MQNNKLLSASQASKYLGIHIETLRRWDREGKLPAIRIGKSNHRRYTKDILDKLKKGEMQGKVDSPNHPSSIYADRVIDFHSSAVPDDEYFSRIVLAIAERVEKFTDCELVDGPHDKKRDILGYQIGRYSKRLPIYIQCKHVRDITEGLLKDEINGLYTNITEGKIIKPYKLYFALSTYINATIRDNIKAYAEQILGIDAKNVVFWCPKELDIKIKGESSILNQFILTGQINVDTSLPSNTNLDLSYETIKRNLTRSTQLIQSRQFHEAEEKLHILLGKIPTEEKFSSERAKVFNNLGLCYKWDGIRKDNFEKALGAFNTAIELDPTLWKAHCNLINTLLLTKNPEDDKKAWELTTKLWKDVGPVDEFIVITYLQAYSIHLGKEKGLEEAERVGKQLIKDGKESLFENVGIWHFLASTYFFVEKYPESEKHLKKILEQDEYDVDAVYLNAMIKMRIAKQATNSVGDFLDNYKSSPEIRVVESLLKKAYLLAKDSERYDLLPEIYHNWNVCRLWLWKTTGEKLEKLEVPDNYKVDDDKLALIPEHLLNKDSERAFSVYEAISAGENFPVSAKWNIAWIFNDYGYPELSLRILEEIEVNPLIDLPYKHWLFKSACQVLTENKALALESCNKAKQAAKDDKKALKEVLSHSGALLMRYQKEGDRLLQNAMEYDLEFPSDKILTKLDINNEEDKQVVIKSMVERKQWFENILQIYRDNPLPAYFLQKSFKRPFIELWAGRGANFPWEYHVPSEDFKQHLIELLENSDTLIFDYISLLTLIKANLVGFLERTNKKVVVHRETFNKVQDELVQFENETLRKLWNYLRKSASVTLVASNEEISGDLTKVSKIFENWLLQSIQLAKNNNYTFVTDDLRLSRVINNEKIPVINTFTFLSYAFEKKWIEKKDYSQFVGEIADCVYSFIPFNYEDLHEIIWQDDYKLTRRSFHLIHQIFLPGAGILSFITVFIEFIRHLWLSGALSEDKIFWLKFITEEISFLFKEWEERKIAVTDEGREFVNRFAIMWGTAVQSGNEEDLSALKAELANTTEDQFVYKIKDSVLKHIEIRLTQINVSKTTK